MAIVSFIHVYISLCLSKVRAECLKLISNNPSKKLELSSIRVIGTQRLKIMFERYPTLADPSICQCVIEYHFTRIKIVA